MRTPLRHSIHLRFPPIDLHFQIQRLSERTDNEVWGMPARFFAGPTGFDDPVLFAGKQANLELWVGHWGDSVRRDAQTIVLHSRHSLLDERFGQIELTTCLADHSAIYLTKNVTRYGGEGAIVRLNSGTDSDEERRERRADLVAALGAQVVEFDDMEHLVVTAIPRRELNRRSPALLHRVLTDLLLYAGNVECIRSGNAGAESEQTAGQGPRYGLSAAERALVEQAAMLQATALLEEQGYTVLDVSDRKVGYDLLASRGREELFVEVKGTTAAPWAVELTPNEHRCALRHQEKYLLLVVLVEAGHGFKATEVVQLPNPTGSSACCIVPSRYVVTPS